MAAHDRHRKSSYRGTKAMAETVFKTVAFVRSATLPSPRVLMRATPTTRSTGTM